MESSNHFLTKEMGPVKKKIKSGRISPRVLFSCLDTENNKKIMGSQTHEAIGINSKSTVSWKPLLELNLAEPSHVESHQFKALESTSESYSNQTLNISAPNNCIENVWTDENSQKGELYIPLTNSENYINNEINNHSEELSDMVSHTIGIRTQKSPMNLEELNNLNSRPNFEKSFSSSSHNEYFIDQELSVNIENALKNGRHIASNISFNDISCISNPDKKIIEDQFSSDKKYKIDETNLLVEKNKTLTEARNTDLVNFVNESIQILEFEKYSPELASQNVTIIEKSQNSLNSNRHQTELENSLKNLEEKRAIVVEELDTNKNNTGDSSQSHQKNHAMTEIQANVIENVKINFEKNRESEIFNPESCTQETSDLTKESTILRKNGNLENLDPFQGTVSNSQFLRLECEITESEKEQLNHFVNDSERKVSLINENINGVNGQIEWQKNILKRMIQDIDELNKTVVKATAALKSQHRKLTKL